MKRLQDIKSNQRWRYARPLDNRTNAKYIPIWSKSPERGKASSINPDLARILRDNPTSYSLPPSSGVLWDAQRQLKGMRGGLVNKQEVSNGKGDSLTLKQKIADEQGVMLLGSSILPATESQEGSSFSRYITARHINLTGAGSQMYQGLEGLGQLQRFRADVKKMVAQHGSVKFHLAVKVAYKKTMTENGEEIAWEVRNNQSEYISSQPAIISARQQARGLLERQIDQISSVIRDKMLGDRQAQDGVQYNLALDRILSLNLNVIKYNPLNGSGWVPTSKLFLNRRVGNVNNIGGDSHSKCAECGGNPCNHCFKHAITTALLPDTRIRVSDCQTAWVSPDFPIKWDGLTFPVSIDQMDTFEEHNPNYQVVVLQYTPPPGEEVLNDSKQFDRKVDGEQWNPISVVRSPPLSSIPTTPLWLLLVGDHYCSVRSPSALLKQQVNTHDCNSVEVCPHCFKVCYTSTRTTEESVRILTDAGHTLKTWTKGKIHGDQWDNTRGRFLFKSKFKDWQKTAVHALFQPDNGVIPSFTKKDSDGMLIKVLGKDLHSKWAASLKKVSAVDVLHQHHRHPCIASSDQDTPPPLIKMPKDGETLSWKYRHAQVKTPWFIVSDFESTLAKIDKDRTRDDETAGIRDTHQANSYYIRAIYEDNIDELDDHLKKHRDNINTQLDRTKLERHFTANSKDDDVLGHFYDDLWEIRNHILELNSNFPTFDPDKFYRPGDETKNGTATECYLCNTPFSDTNRKNRDHCHLTGYYRGPACGKCNKALVVTGPRYKIPTFFHNLSGYDSHHLVQKAHLFTEKCDEEAFGGRPQTPKQQKVMKTVGELPPMEEEEETVPAGHQKTDTKTASNLGVIALNNQKIKTFWVNNIQFLDSMAHMKDSLDNLTKNLLDKETRTKGKTNMFPETRQHFRQRFPAATDTDLLLLLRKGVYPYNWMDDLAKMATTMLPPQDDFYNVLSRSGIADKEYRHAQQVWTAFDCKTFLDYHNLYLELDVCLLGDILRSYRHTGIAKMGIDPFHVSNTNYFSLPAYSWDCMLKLTQEQRPGFKIELLTDQTMYEFFEGRASDIFAPDADGKPAFLRRDYGMGRGGLSFVGDRSATANNKHMGGDYDPAKPSSYIMYLDANNLYSVSQSLPTPYKDFRWMGDGELAALASSDPAAQLRLLEEWYLTQYGDGAEAMPMMTNLPPCKTDYRGMVLEVDLEYPDPLHDAFNNFPMAVQKGAVENANLSPYQRGMLAFYKQKLPTTEKLLPTLEKKVRYKLHIRNLLFYLQHGMVMTKLHRGVKFTESAFLRHYVDKCTAFRKAATNDFEKAFWKLSLNAIFGKSQENVRGYTDFRLLNTRRAIQQAGKNPRLQMPVRLYNEHLVGASYSKATVNLNKPVFIGSTVLDLSKLWMYKFHYDYLQRRYTHDNIRVLMSDTDSLCFEIYTEDFYADMVSEEGLPWFDRSNFEKGHEHLDKSRAKELGLFKDEAGGIPIKQFDGLRAKMYSIQTTRPAFDGSDTKGAMKGIPRVAAKGITQSDFSKTLQGLPNAGTFIKFPSIRAKDHQIYTLQCHKVGLSRFDDKGFLTFGERSIKYGHKDLRPGTGAIVLKEEALAAKGFTRDFLGGKTLEDCLETAGSDQDDEDGGD